MPGGAKPVDRVFKLADSASLFLLVQPNGSQLWRCKFRLDGVEGLQALGAFPEVSLCGRAGRRRCGRYRPPPAAV